MAKAAKKFSRTIYLILNSLFFGAFVLIASSVPQLLRKSGEVADADTTYGQSGYYGQSSYYAQGIYGCSSKYCGTSGTPSDTGDSDSGCDSDADADADCADAY